MIRIGITGHRVLSKPQSVEAGILEVLSKIISIYPNGKFTICSALAEGADCLFVEKSIDQLQAKLEVRLPLPVSEYRKDFSTPESLEIFERLLKLADNISQEKILDSRESAYLAAGKYILNQCDILVAIWDGQKARGQGGTGEIVHLAREYGCPLAWIRSGNRHPGTHIPVDLGEQQGKVVYERFPI